MPEEALLAYRDVTAWKDQMRGAMLLPEGSEWPRYRWIEEWINHGDRVLDVGCNSGQTIRNLQSRVPRVDCCGVDIDPEFIEFCKDRDKLPQRYFVCAGEYVHSCFPKARFDVVMALEVIEHVNHLRPFLDSLLHVLNPGGLLLISTPMPHSIIGYEYMKVHPQHRRVFNFDRLCVVMETMGLVTEAIEPVEKLGYGFINFCGAFRKPLKGCKQ